MKKSFLVLMLTGLGTLTGWAQTTLPQMEIPAVQQTLNALAASGNTGIVRTFDGRAVGLKGSPMLYTDWLPGEALLVNNTLIKDAQFKYNVPARRVLVLRRGKDSTQIEAYNVKSLTLTPVNGVVQHYEHLPALKGDVPAVPADLVRVIHRGAYSLVQLPVKGFYKATSKSPYGEARDYDEFRDEPIYVLVRPDGIAEKVKLSRKSLAGALNEKGDAFTRYMKENKLDVEVEDDVVKALNSLSQ